MLPPNQTGRDLVIGVDGGGTGCRARVEDGEGRVLGTGVGGPAAVRFGSERSMDAVLQACNAALAAARLPPDSLGAMDAAIGLAGLSRKGAAEKLTALAHPFRSVRFVDDAVIACIGAHGGADGGIVIIGTGSAGVARVEGRVVRVGGYGFPISDEASGADLGLQALRLALRAHDGRSPATDFTREMMSRFGDDPFEAVAWMDRATATDYATFAPLVVRHANAGDPVAGKILRQAAGEIGALVMRLVEAGAPRIALLGGLSPHVQPWLAVDVQRILFPARGDALDGALQLARGMAASF
ncbi:MAG: N-acetylglucosamine kinase [Enhydrobacter sp.]|nr:N-acetylglucosamine kinase [Enhydrobacter sp.]